MAGQETLIYIDENDKKDAGISAKNFAKEDTQNRAYYNTLGAQLVKKYLASENVDVSNIYNIHSIRKILEEFDVSDIILDNIHIDVRVVFNENFIFIPKSHFKYQITPDIYLVLLMSNDKKFMKFLGFFEPQLINKNNQNEDYYFIEKEKLSSPANLKDFINDNKGDTTNKLSSSEIEKSDMMILSLIDQDINEQSKTELLKNLVKSSELRDRFIEFENFELLAYKAITSDDVVKPLGLDISFDNAAIATAAALEEFNLANAAEISNVENDIMNGFNDLKRNIPDLTPQNTKTSEIEGKVDSVTNLSELPDFIDIEDLSVGEASENNINKTEELSVQDPDDENTLEFSPVDETQELTVDFINYSTDKLNSEIDTVSSLETSNETIQDIVNFDDMVELTEEEPVMTIELEEISSETVNFADIKEDNIDKKTYETNETYAETVDFADVSAKDENPLSNMLEEPALELENFENLSLDINSEENIDNDTKKKFEKTETSEEFKNESEILLPENLSKDMSLVTDLTYDAPLEEVDEKTKLSIEDESGLNENDRASSENIMLDSIENLILEDEKSHQPYDISDNEILDKDEELDQMLNIENLTPENLETEIIEEIENEKTTEDADAITDLNLDAEEVQKSTESDDIGIDDLKELGIGVEILPSAGENEEIETGDLISQIDDLLGGDESVKKATEINSNSYDDDDKLKMLFSTGEVLENENVMSSLDETDEYNDIPVISQKTVSTPEKGKKAIIVAAAIVAVLAAAGGAGMFLKSKNTSSDMMAQNPIESDTTNLPPTGTASEQVPDNTDLMTNQPDINKTAPAQNPQNKVASPKTNKEASSKPTQTKTQKPKQSSTAMPYVSVKSIVWEVPDYLSYSDKVKKYLQSAGKSIRLSLSSDLLLANEYAYSNQVKVELKLKNDGTVESAQITKSSGSNQINDIVLRTVKDTLKVVRPAPGEIPTANFKLGLIINL